MNEYSGAFCKTHFTKKWRIYKHTQILNHIVWAISLYLRLSAVICCVIYVLAFRTPASCFLWHLLSSGRHPWLARGDPFINTPNKTTSYSQVKNVLDIHLHSCPQVQGRWRTVILIDLWRTNVNMNILYIFEWIFFFLIDPITCCIYWSKQKIKCTT